MRFDLKKRRQISKSEVKEREEKVLGCTNGYITCGECEGTGVERDDQYSWNCRVCKGRGIITKILKRKSK